MAHICQRCKKEIAPGDGVDLGMNADGIYFHSACWERQKAKDAAFSWRYGGGFQDGRPHPSKKVA